MANLNLVREKTALLCMDFHNNVVKNVYQEPGRDVARAARTALEAARRARMTVIHVELFRRPGLAPSARNKFAKMIRTRVPAPPPGQEAWAMQPAEGLEPAEGEFVVHKPRVNAFYASDLEWLLRVRDIDTLVLMGTTTDFVVEMTARHAADADYRVIVLEDCCASWTAQSHQASMAVLEMLADIAKADDFVKGTR